jgi:hypothetical protein
LIIVICIYQPFELLCLTQRLRPEIQMRPRP